MSFLSVSDARSMCFPTRTHMYFVCVAVCARYISHLDCAVRYAR